MAGLSSIRGIAGVVSLSTALMGCADSHEGRSHPRVDAASEGDEQDAAAAPPPTQDGGSGDADAAQTVCDAGVPKDGACASSRPTAPDCNVASCTGAVRWTRRLEAVGAGDAGAPRMRFTEVSADRGVVLNVEDARSVRFAGSPIRTDAVFGPTGYPGKVLVRLDAEGAQVDGWPLLPSADGNLVSGHAESLIVLNRWNENGKPDFSALWPGTTELQTYELPRDLHYIEAKRERWTSVQKPAAAPAEECGGTEGVARLLEHRDLRGSQLLGRACVRTDRNLMQLELLPSGGLAVLVSTGSTMGPPILTGDFGEGRVTLDLGHYLVVWNADGSLRYLRPLGVPLVHLHVGGDDEVWAVEITAALSARFRRFDARGELRTEGVTPEGGNPSALRVDSAGNALLVGAAGPGLGTLRKISPEGKLIWLREVTAALDIWSLQVDAAGHSYVLSEDGLTLYQFDP